MTSALSMMKLLDFRKSILGVNFYEILNQMSMIAIAWQMYHYTKSPLALGAIGLAKFIPLLLCAIPGGILADRFSRRGIMYLGQFFLAAIAGAFAIANLLGYGSPTLLYVYIVAHSTVYALLTPARWSFLPLVVPAKLLPRAISIGNTLWQVTMVLGPALAGLALAHTGVQNIYLIYAGSAIASGIYSWLIYTTKPTKQHRANTKTNMFSLVAEPLSYIGKSRLLTSIILVDFFATFFASATVMMPYYASEVFKVGPEGLGILYAAPSIGGILGGLLFTWLHPERYRGRILFSVVIVYGLCTALFAYSSFYFLSLALLSVAGFSDTISAIIRGTIRQSSVPDNLRGRVTGVTSLFVIGGPQLGEFEAGLAATLLGVSGSVAFGGFGAIVATVAIAKFFPELRRYHGEHYSESNRLLPAKQPAV